MQVEIIGRKTVTKTLVDNLTRFYVKELKLTNSKYSLYVQMVPNLTKECGYKGAVIKIDDSTLSMAVDSRLNITELVITVAHEMVHVKQYAKGQLKTYIKRNGKTGFKWCGKAYDAAYYDQPWELEAFGRERILAIRIAKLINC